MPRFPRWRHLFRLATGRSTAAEDLDEELRLHLDLRVAELIEDGWEADAARAEAARRFGNVDHHRRITAGIDRGREGEMRRSEWWDEVRQDFHFALRTLRRQPGFSAVAVLTLAFGIGAATAILSIVNGVLLRPLPYPNADRVVQVWQTGQPGTAFDGTVLPFSTANFVDVRAQSSAFRELAAFRNWNYTLTLGGEADLLAGVRASPGFFEALGVKPAVGRTFTAADEQAGSEAVAILGDGLWRRRFGADPAIVGRAITLNGEQFTVVGVMPRGFQFPRGTELPAAFQFAARTELWTPLVVSPSELEFRGTLNLAVIGLPRADVTPAAVAADLELVMGRVAEQNPRLAGSMTARAGSLREQAVAGVRPALLVLLGAVGFLLLIACVNVSNLLLTRTAARYREVAVRTALGAGRHRLLRQFVTENLLLALAGGGLGVVVAGLGKNALLALAPESLPRLDDVAVDWRVLGGVMALVLLVGLGFGALVVSEALQGDQIEALREGSKGSGGRARRRLRQGLVVLEVAVSVVLLAGAGLLGRTFLNLRSVGPGLRTDRVMTAQVSLPLVTSDFRQFPRLAPGWARFYQQLTDQLAERPGIEAVGVVTTLPLTGAWESTVPRIEGRPAPEPGEGREVMFAGASEGYFQALGIPLVRGRLFSIQDRDSASAVALVNEAMARTYWPGQDPVGEHLEAFFGRPLEIVGIVGDVRVRDVASPPPPAMYFPLSVYPGPTMQLVVRTAGEPLGQLPAIRATLRELDPTVPLTTPRTMEDVLAQSLAQQRFSALLIGGFAVAALLLAVLGLYGVISFGVARRRREIGVRLALGAEPGRVVSMVVREGLLMAAIGVLIGLVGAVALGRLLAGLVYQVSPTDPLTLGTVAALLLGVAALASLVPARRAMRVDPVSALREE